MGSDSKRKFGTFLMFKIKKLKRKKKHRYRRGGYDYL